VLRDSIYTLLARCFVIVGKLVYSIFINRTLGPGLKGAFELIQLAPDTLVRFGNFGFDQSNTYLSGRKPDTIPRLISNALRMTLVISLPAIALGAGYMLLPMNQKVFFHVPLWVGFLALIVIPISILDMLLEAVLYGENRIWVRNVHAILRIVAALIFMGIFVVGLKWAVQGAVYGYILITASLLSFSFLMLRRFHKPRTQKWDNELAKESWQFGKYMWAANFASYLFYNVDRWLINALAHGTTDEVLAQVGLYGTAVNVIVNIWIIPDAIQTALTPKITQKGESERRKLVPPSLRAVTLMVLLAMVLLAVVAKPALALLYNRPGAPWDFSLAYTPLMLLMPGIFTLSLAKVFTADFFSRGKPHYAMWVSITSLVLNVIFNLVLIPSSWSIRGLPINGMNGAAIASSISYTFSFLMFLYFYIRESGERSRDIFLPKKSDFQLVMTYLRAAWGRIGMDDRNDREVGS